jgi:hypothetical protein
MSETKNWKVLFNKKFTDAGYDTNQTSQIYLLDMELKTFFEFAETIPSCLKLENMERDAQEFRYYWKSLSVEAACPVCGQISTHLHKDYYTKRVQDIPKDNLAVFHHITCNRYDCENPECDKSVFVERFHEIVEENALKTVRFKSRCIDQARSSGCFVAGKEIRAEGGVVSGDSIIRYLKAEAAETVKLNTTTDRVRVLALDDINLRKGDKSSGCTVFIDEETHKVLVIVMGTTKEAAERIIKQFPSAEFVSRDRASSYSSAASAHGKTQIADRFHLMQNAHKAVEDALKELMPTTIFVKQGDGWVQKPGSVSDKGSEILSVPEQTVEDRIRLAGLTPVKAKKYRDTLKMLELSAEGLTTPAIAKEMGVTIKDIRALRGHAASTLQNVEDKINHRIERGGKKTVSGSRTKPSKDSIVDPFRETVIEMWNAGENHRSIHPVIRDIGYTGSANSIYQYILKLSDEEPELMRKPNPRTRQKVNQTHNNEVPLENFDIDEAKNRPSLSFNGISRNEVYKDILKEASESRPKFAEKKNHDDNSLKDVESQNDKPSEGYLPPIDNPPNDAAREEAKPKKSAKVKSNWPASAKISPLPRDILELIYGVEKIEEPTAPEPQKKRI